MTRVWQGLPVKLEVIVCIVLTFGQIAAWAAGAPQVPAAAKNTVRPAESTWQEKWQSTVAEAKKEGEVSIYATWTPEMRKALTLFTKKYGIILNFQPFSRGADMLAKVQTEKVAGLKSVDVFGSGGPTLIGMFKPLGLLGPIEPLLILPEVLDANKWRGGKLPFLDKDKVAMGLIASVQRYILINTEMVKPGEITSYQDLLNPKYKGKIALNDPTVTGSGSGMIGHLAKDIWNEERALNYLKQVLDQQPAITRDNRLQVEWVAKGKYPIGLGVNPEVVATFLELGAPITVVIPKTRVFISPAAGAFALPWQPPHPKATQVFINWLASKEGEAAFAKGFGNLSARADIPPEGVNPLLVPQTDEKIVMDSEEHILLRAKLLKPIADILAAANK